AGTFPEGRRASGRRLGIPPPARHPGAQGRGLSSARLPAHYRRQRRRDARGGRGARGIPEASMSAVYFERVAFIGIGHIGSSLARLMRRDKLAGTIVACARRQETL